MIEEKLTVKNPAGLHARSARLLVDKVQNFDSEVTIENGDVVADASSILEVMMLSAHAGTTLTVEIDGADEAEAYEALKKLFERGFDET